MIFGLKIQPAGYENFENSLKLDCKMDFDLVFVVDSTGKPNILNIFSPISSGSMGSWVNSVKQQCKKISDGIKENEKCKSLRVGFILYRDYPQDRSYVSLAYPLLDVSKESATIEKNLRDFNVGGGGDFQESLTAALYDLQRMEWRSDSLKTAIVIGDAPPHGQGRHGDGFPIHDPSGEDFIELAHSCRELGIFVHSVACGSNRDTVASLKAIAEAGSGVYLCIRDASRLSQIVINCSFGDFEMFNLRNEVYSLIQEIKVDLQKCNNEDNRVSLLLKLAKEKKIQVENISPNLEKNKVDVTKKHLSKVFPLVRRKYPDDELINDLFPNIGTKGLIPRSSQLLEKKKNLAIPITNIKINAIAKGIYHEVQIQQTFVNNFDFPIEAVYSFPILSNSCVVAGFTAEVDGKLFRGKVMEKEKARELYDDSIASGKGAFMLKEKEDQDNLFEVSIGNVSPGKTVKITITYLQESMRKENFRRIVIPTIYAPNSVSMMKENKYEVEVNITNETKNKLKCVSGHHLKEIESGSYSVDRIAGGLQNDILLHLEEESSTNCVVVEEKDSMGNAFYCSFNCKYEKQTQKDEQKEKIMIIVDTSFSMHKNKDIVKKLVLQFVDLLQKFEGAELNIASFSNLKTLLFEDYSKVDKKIMMKIEKFVGALKYSGGSELYSVIRNLLRFDDLSIVTGPNEVELRTKRFNKLLVKEKPTSVVLVSDGMYHRTEKILEMVKMYPEIKYLGFGVGKSVRYQFLTEFCKANDSCEFVHDIHFEKEVVEQQINRIFNLLTVKGSNFELSRKVIVPSKWYSCFGFFDPVKTKELVIKAIDSFQKEVVITVPIEIESEEVAGDVFHKFAAKEVINNKFGNENELKLMKKAKTERDRQEGRLKKEISENKRISESHERTKKKKEEKKKSTFTTSTTTTKPKESKSGFSSWLWGRFSKKKKSTPDVIAKNRDTIELLEKRAVAIQKKMESEIKKAKEFLRKKEKSEAKKCMERKKKYESQLSVINKQITNLENISMKLEESALEKDIIMASKTGATDLKSIHKSVGGIDRIEDTMDDIRDSMDDAAEISEALGHSLGVDDEELLDELDALEMESLDEDLCSMDIGSPTDFSSGYHVPRASGSKKEKDELDEFAELEAELLGLPSTTPPIPTSDDKPSKKQIQKPKKVKPKVDPEVERITKMAVLYQIACKYTSFVAVEEKEEPTFEEMVVVDVESEQPKEFFVKHQQGFKMRGKIAIDTDVGILLDVLEHKNDLYTFQNEGIEKIETFEKLSMKQKIEFLKLICSALLKFLEKNLNVEIVHFFLEHEKNLKVIAVMTEKSPIESLLAVLRKIIDKNEVLEKLETISSEEKDPQKFIQEVETQLEKM